MGKIVFTLVEEDRGIEFKLSSGLTWWDLSDQFLSFLQGCGYQVTQEDFASYWESVSNTTNETAINTDIMDDDLYWPVDDTIVGSTVNITRT